jgi:hypothetical protein
MPFGRNITNYGTQGYINAWDAPQGAPANETSINQTSVFRGSPLQTVEVGTIEGMGFGTAPKMFVYYTTNGYASSGNHVGGYNSSVTGWVQWSTTKVPGVTLSGPLSTSGGDQYENFIATLKNGSMGGWWVYWNDEWIGYYPSSLFSASGLNPRADGYSLYGEVYDSNAPASTSTDLGSGQFPSAGWTFAAYMRNIARYTDTTGSSVYDASWGGVITDSNCYTGDVPFTSSDPSLQNWAYFGGPGREHSGCN